MSNMGRILLALSSNSENLCGLYLQNYRQLLNQSQNDHGADKQTQGRKELFLAGAG